MKYRQAFGQFRKLEKRKFKVAKETFRDMQTQWVIPETNII